METCVDINLSNSELFKLVSKAKDWVLLKGKVCSIIFMNKSLKYIELNNFFVGLAMKSKENYHQDQVNIAPFLFLPTPFPRKEFILAEEVQSLLNELMHKVAYDHEFLSKTLKKYVYITIIKTLLKIQLNRFIRFFKNNQFQYN